MVFSGSGGSTQWSLVINAEEVERVHSIKFFGIYIKADLIWALNTSNLVKRAEQRLFFLRKLKRHLSRCCIVWYSSCAVENRKDLSQVVKTAQRIVGAALPDLDFVYADRLQRKVKNMSADVTHLGHSLFVPLPSG